MMFKKGLFQLLLFFSFLFSFGQKIVIDSIENSYFQKENLLILNKLDLVDLKKSNYDFHLRLSYHGTIVDFWKDSLNQYKGFVTKYVFQSDDNISLDTLSRKFLLSGIQLRAIDSVFQSNKLDDIRDDSKIPEWRFGFDGITYDFEKSTKESYSIKSYWTPKSQDSTLLEVKQINSFIDDFYQIIKNDSLSKEFQKDLPSGFSYSNGSGLHFYKIKVSNSYFYVDYFSNFRLPIGFKTVYYVNKIKKKQIRVGASILFQHGFNANSTLEAHLYKYGLFTNLKNYSDGIHVTYKKNKLDYVSPFSIFESYLFNYAGGIDKWFDFQLGIEELKTINKQEGIYLGISKSFNKINLEPYFNCSIFKNQTNYNLGVQKSFRVKTDSKQFRIYTNLYLEKYFNYNSINASLYIPIKYFTVN